jgi:hypothetical protein
MKSGIQFCIIILAASFGLAGCENKYDRMQTGGTERTGVHLDKDAAVLIATPRDPAHNRTIYKGAGEDLARMMNSTFSEYARIVDVYPESTVPLDKFKDAAGKSTYGYIVIPTIVDWGPHDKDFLKAINHAAIKVKILDALTGAEVSSTYIEGKSPEWDSYNPFNMKAEGLENLLYNPLDEYVYGLYAK